MSEPRPRSPQVYTIPPQVGFVDALAQGLLDRTADEPLGLARAQVWLPNRRAVRALTQAFVRLSGDGLLLPRMTPLAGIEGDGSDGDFDCAEFADDLDAVAEIPPAIDPLKRRLLLARLVRRSRGDRLTSIEALRLADQLAAAFDLIEYEEIDASKLSSLVDDELAEHWQQTLKVFEVMLDLWPKLLAAHGEIDPAVRQRRLLAALVARWEAGGAPAGLIVAAGMTGAAPPTARLLARVARLPQGMIVLPGLDTATGEPEWAAIRCHLTEPDAEHAGADSESHPQYALKGLLHHLGVARGEVQPWPAATATDGPAARTAAVARAMSPAAFTGNWRDVVVPPALFAGVRTVVATDAAEEAQVIALALRRSLEISGATAALVTPDRGLARRVASHCARWGIDVDDSAGTPLRVTPPGALLLALIETAARGFTPVSLLAVLKHPLVRRGEGRLDWLDSVRRLDLDVRGVRPAPGLTGIAARVGERDAERLATADRASLSKTEAALPAERQPSLLMLWWAALAELLAPLEALFAASVVGLTHLIAAVREVGTALCGDELWRGPEGRALAALVTQLEAHGDNLDAFDPGDAPALIAAFLGETAVRAPFGKHPRLAIYGLLEARLQRADLMILGGLNEGSWPPLPSPDPWLSPVIRSRLRLPALERRIGLAAHDFVAALGAPQVLMTRARQGDSAPGVASRLWLRLQALAGEALQPDTELLGWARALDRSEVVQAAARPRPAPAAALRPRQISVTAAEQLKADPFSFYASRLLRLRALKPLDEDPGAADRGIAVHRILEGWVHGGDLDPATLAALTEAELARWQDHPLMQALWAPRVRRMMTWTTETLAAWEADGWVPVAAEAKASATLANGIVLTGIADRIDRNRAGRLAVIDYKTGLPPSHAQWAGGYALQLGLLGALAAAGEFEGVAPGPVEALRYWQLGGGKDPGKVHDRLKHYSELTIAADHIAATRALFATLCDEMLLGDAPFTAKLHPEYSAKYSDFDQLARVLEWRGRPDSAAARMIGDAAAAGTPS